VKICPKTSPIRPLPKGDKKIFGEKNPLNPFLKGKWLLSPIDPVHTSTPEAFFRLPKWRKEIQTNLLLKSPQARSNGNRIEGLF